MLQNIWWKINWSIIKNVIYKYPPSFLTLPAFYQLVCNTVWIEACAWQFSPIKQRRLFALDLSPYFFYGVCTVQAFLKMNPNDLKKLFLFLFSGLKLRCSLSEQSSPNFKYWQDFNFQKFSFNSYPVSQSWVRVPGYAFPRSWRFRHTGPRERDFF